VFKKGYCVETYGVTLYCIFFIFGFYQVELKYRSKGYITKN